jgi:hypothetical protein
LAQDKPEPLLSSLNEARCHTLDRCRNTAEPGYPSPDARLFFGGANYAVLLLQKGHGDQVASDIAEERNIVPTSGSDNAH